MHFRMLQEVLARQCLFRVKEHIPYRRTSYELRVTRPSLRLCMFCSTKMVKRVPVNPQVDQELTLKFVVKCQKTQ